MGYDHFVRQWILDHRFLTVLKLISRHIAFCSSLLFMQPTLSPPPLPNVTVGNIIFRNALLLVV